jgi:hypothetical protein
MLQASFACPVNDGLEQSAPDAAAAPRGIDPHPTDPTRIAALAIEQPVRRAQHVLASTGEEHHVMAGFRDGAGEVPPVGQRSRRRLGQRVAERVRGLMQGAKPEVAVEIDLV